MARRNKVMRFFIFRLLIKALSGLDDILSSQLAIAPGRVFFHFKRINTISEYQKTK